MTDTPQMSLPLLAPAQAQKHVTVNEALARIDALTHLVLASVSVASPPVSAPDGTLHGVPDGATDEWAGQAGQLALRMGGGWVFVPPRVGWRAFVRDVGVSAIWDGTGWQMGAMTLSPAGAALAGQSLQFDLPIAAGASVAGPRLTKVVAATAWARAGSQQAGRARASQAARASRAKRAGARARMASRTEKARASRRGKETKEEAGPRYCDHVLSA